MLDQLGGEMLVGESGISSIASYVGIEEDMGRTYCWRAPSSSTWDRHRS